MAYIKTNWTNTTPINPTNLNKLENGIEQNSNKITVLENKFNYSTEEQVVGTWIDGKPLYRKVINCGTLTNGGTKEVPTGLSNVTYIDWEGIATGSGGVSPWPYKMAVTGNDYGVKAEISDNIVRVRINIDLSNYTGYVTILYTKN